MRAGLIAVLLVAACSGGKSTAPNPVAKADPTAGAPNPDPNPDPDPNRNPNPNPNPSPNPNPDPNPNPNPNPNPDPSPVRVGADFTAEAKLLYRLVACGNDEPIADAALAKVVARHCKWAKPKLAAYRARYIDGGRAFFDSIIPAGIPKTVVYPFGGGDLISALAAFPDADEITTISLELAGDPRRIDGITAKQLDASLGRLRGELGGTLSVGSNTSVNLSASQRNDLPGQVSSFLLGLAAAGFEPVGMRYLTLADDGAIHYVTAEEIDALDAARAKSKGRKGSWNDPNFSEAFANVEIEYRKVGDPADRVRVHRHFGWNLHDDELRAAPQLIKHLEGKGKVTVLVKGASYLLWASDFSVIRDYLLGHLAWMLSDSTGIPPEYARAAGMVQETYGHFSGPFLDGAEARTRRHADAFRTLWRSQPTRPLPFRFGYVDSAKAAHLLVTKPANP